MRILMLSAIVIGALICTTSAGVRQSSAATLDPAPQKTADEFERDLSRPIAATSAVSSAPLGDAHACPAGKEWDDEDQWCDDVKKGLQGFNLGVTHRAVARVPASGQTASLLPAARVYKVNTPMPAATSDLKVNFANNSYELDPQARATLREFVRYLARPSAVGVRIELGGHTNAVGAYDTNVMLSGKRADAVKAFLVSEGVESTRLVTHGYGFDAPLPGTDPKAAENRRVEAKVVQ